MSDVANVDPREIKNVRKVAMRMAFSKCVDGREVTPPSSVDGGKKCEWNCCGEQFTFRRDIHKHVASKHSAEVEAERENLVENTVKVGQKGSCSILGLLKRKRVASEEEPEDDEDESCAESELPTVLTADDVHPWLPSVEGRPTAEDSVEGRMILFYQYRKVHNTKHVLEWQKALCQRLGLTGKIRIAKEGMNSTLGGTVWATEVYMNSMMNHPLFECMTPWDFKRSAGSAACFPDGLKVNIFSEICPMGVEPAKCPHTAGGVHLNVDDFHQAAERYVQSEDEKKEAVFVDCRNFYESDIGRFEGALMPNIRKFSYWPEYVDKNLDVFQDKRVYMYCTGGIRCERGSAYLKAKGICQEVYQLQGGIHKYMEKYPEGHFRGKMFVFDDRYYIKANDDILGKCRYCEVAWDQHRPCSSKHCHQYVLSCQQCTDKGHTACCLKCQQNQDQGQHREECDCTANRPRIPVENPN